MYTVLVARRVDKQIAKVSPGVKPRIVSSIAGLREDPRPQGCKKLVDGGGAWRVKAGDYRILYDIDVGSLTVIVLAVLHRSEAYRRGS